MDPRQMDVMNDVEFMEYPLELTLPKEVDATVEAALTINTCDFAIMNLKHCVVGDDGTNAMQYSIDWSIQNDRRFWKGSSAPMALMFGSPRTSIWTEFRKPIRIMQQVTLYVKLTNRYAADLADDIKVQILFCGYELRAGK